MGLGPINADLSFSSSNKGEQTTSHEISNTGGNIFLPGSNTASTFTEPKTLLIVGGVMLLLIIVWKKL